MQGNFWDGPVDPDVARAYNFLGWQKRKREG